MKTQFRAHSPRGYWEASAPSWPGMQDIRAKWAAILRNAFVLRWRQWLVIGCVLLVLCVSAMLVAHEMRTSHLQARYITGVARDLSYRVEAGASDAIRFPKVGPYDQRLGYTRLPGLVEKLTASGYAVKSQARFSPRLLKTTDLGMFPIYQEKTQAGITLLDREGESFFITRYPERVYPNFEAIPPRVVETLLFIENRELLDPRFPQRNPALEWDRFSYALLHQGIRFFDEDHNAPGGSTLATQIEKYRHSAEGRTSSPREKLRQIASASLRSYLDGPDTLGTRRRIVLDYLNSLPFGAVAGRGEIIGLGDGMWAWYGTDFPAFNQCLSQDANKVSDLEAWALNYKQMLSLFLAQRRPSFYLSANPTALEEQTNTYIRLLADSRLISRTERDAALQATLRVQRQKLSQHKLPLAEQKAANAIRPRLLTLLDVPQLYELDRLDLTAQTTLDSAVQREVTKVLCQLRDPAYAEAAGLRGPRILEQGDPAKVVYSFLLYERIPGANVLRVQADNFDQPLNINEGIKLELGSTAKLRTLITYLEIIAELHQQYAGHDPQELRSMLSNQNDTLTQWVIQYLLNAPSISLREILEAAMERRYSANPGERFFTGGGLHTFTNFDRSDNGRVLSVREAFYGSVNLVFIRVMRDVVHHYLYLRDQSLARVLQDIEDPRRQVYLAQFADQEGKVFLRRFYRKYHGKSADEQLALLVQSVYPIPARLATVFRSIDPDGGVDKFSAFMRMNLPDSRLSEETLADLYRRYAIDAYPLTDRGYIARVHPLELWLLAYLRQHPEAQWAQVVQASAQERQAVYTWLFKTRHKNRQDVRIRVLLEAEAFQEIHQAWKRLGYPFESLVPSYATAIGSSADRPAALAELMGIILNDGVRNPSVRVTELRFGQDTPYETVFERQLQPGEQVLRPEIATILREALAGVVEHGTAQRVRQAFVTSDGETLRVGGKTGTGDNRRDIYGPRAHLIQSQVMNRTGTFVFFIGDRFFGTLTAYVMGPEAGNYRFTSALPVQVLKSVAPRLRPLIERYRLQEITLLQPASQIIVMN